MKRFYYSLFAAASMMLAVTSCSQEEDFAQQSSGEMATFEISLEGASQSRNAGDGMTATKLYYEVYQGTKVEPVIDATADLASGKTTVKMPLLRGEKYDILFWAQAANGSIYTATGSLKEITVDYNNPKANKEAYDAFFFGQEDYQATTNVTKIELKRPFAQLNIGTTVDDWNKAVEMVDDTNDPVTKSQVTVTGLATKFNVLTGAATEAKETVTFVGEDNNLLGETFKAKGDNFYYYLAMNYLLVEGTKSSTSTAEEDVTGTTNVTATFWRGNQELFTINNLPNVAIQRNWRTNILGNLLADPKTFEIEVVPGFNNEDHDIDYSSVDNDVDLNTALKNTTDDDIVINLASSSRSGKIYTINVGASADKYYFGGENTKTITINANDNTICFNHENADWNYIRCVNDDTKWIINNAHLTNSGKNDGPWNRHNIRFYNAVELNNVTSDKAIALLNDGKLEGVKISDEHPKNSQAYGLWVASYGQTVELNNCEIVAHSSKSNDLGITINDQYTEEGLAKSKLIVKNTKFVTKEGPAIMVESTAGADIILENIDISGTKDGFNAVWMEKSRKDNFDQVSVEGGTAIIQGEESAENPFMIEGNTVKVAKGVYGTLPAMANGVTIEAEEGTVFTGISGVAGEGVTIKNVRFSNSSTSGQGGDIYALSGTLNGTIFENCHFDALHGARWCYAKGDVVFTDCTFGSETSKRGVHFDGGDGNVTFNNCNFYSFNALGHSISSWKFNECNIKVSSNALSNFNGVNMYATKYEYTNCTFEPNTYTDCTSAGNVTATYTGCSYTDNSPITSVIRFDGDASTCTVTFDGKQINFINKAASIAQAADNSELYLVNGTYDMPSLSGKTITLVGQSKDKTILNMLKTGGNNPQYSAKSITYKNLTVNRPTTIYQGVNAESESFENCILKGLQFLYSNKITYTNCDFDANGAEHCSWTYGAEEVSFTGCTFTYADRGINCYSDQPSEKTKATFTNCTFTKVAGKETTGAIETNSSIMKGLELNINNCTVNEGELWFIPQWDSKNGEKTIVTIDGKRVVATPAQLNVALADATEGLEIYLGKGEFGTILVKSNKTIIGTENAKVDCVNLNGAENLTLMGIKFDAAKAGNGCDGNGKLKQYANIFTGDDTVKPGKGARNLVIEGCTFEGTFTNGGVAIAFTDQSRTSGQSGDITIKGCTFNTQNGYYDIYAHYSGSGYLNIEGNTFDSTVQGLPIYLGRYQSSTPVVVKGNAFNTVATFEDAAYIQKHSDAYTVSFAAENNEFAE